MPDARANVTVSVPAGTGDSVQSFPETPIIGFVGVRKRQDIVVRDNAWDFDYGRMGSRDFLRGFGDRPPLVGKLVPDQPSTLIDGSHQADYR